LLRNPVEELLQLHYLKKMIISYNNLLEMWPLPLQLEILIVSHNNLKSIGENIAKLLNLKVLDVSYNQILNCNGVQQLTKLQTLNLSNNSIDSLEHCNKLVNLKECYLQHNNISIWNSLHPLAELPSIELIVIDENPVLK